MFCIVKRVYREDIWTTLDEHFSLVLSMFYTNHLFKIIYQVSDFRSNPFGEGKMFPH